MSNLNDLIHTNAHNAFGIGVKTEQERIIKLAQARVCFSHADGCDHGACHALAELVELIKGARK